MNTTCGKFSKSTAKWFSNGCCKTKKNKKEEIRGKNMESLIFNFQYKFNLLHIYCRLLDKRFNP